MLITVKYLASLAERLDKHEERLQTDTAMTVCAIWQHFNPDVKLPNNTICAVNHVYARLDNVVSETAEVAFFPPVTGG